MPSTIDLSVATMVNNQLKNCATTGALSACECTSPELRAAFAEISRTAIERQAQLAAMMNTKGWYIPPVADDVTVSALIPQVQAALGGVMTAATTVDTAQETIGRTGVTVPRIM